MCQVASYKASIQWHLGRAQQVRLHLAGQVAPSRVGCTQQGRLHLAGQVAPSRVGCTQWGRLHLAGQVAPRWVGRTQQGRSHLLPGASLACQEPPKLPRTMATAPRQAFKATLSHIILVNISLGCRRLPHTNTLAYLESASVTINNNLHPFCH